MKTYLLAHRGFSKKYPENTLSAVRSALELGAYSVEVDVHLSSDHVPVVFHDRNLNRTCGEDGLLHLMPAEQLRRVSAHYPEKFGSAYKPEPIPLLSELVQIMKQWPQRQLFVEVKRAAVEHFGIDLVMEKIVDDIKDISDQCVIISYNDQVPEKARELGQEKVGWVFENWGDEARQVAHRLQPDYLLSDDGVVRELLDHTPEPFWPGPWQWVLYAVDDVASARFWRAKGVHIIETNDIETLLREL